MAKNETLLAQLVETSLGTMGTTTTFSMEFQELRGSIKMPKQKGTTRIVLILCTQDGDRFTFCEDISKRQLNPNRRPR